MNAGTLSEVLDAGSGEAPAIMCHGGEVISHAQLRAEVKRLTEQLRSIGIGRSDRVAIVLPNGAQMAIAFLAAACAGCAAPLNPRYRESEFSFYLKDLKAKALITDRSTSPAAASAAAGGGVNVANLSGTPGKLKLEIDSPLPSGDEASRRTPGSDATELDTALVLHTSGTTSRPKIVPISQHNLARSALNIAESLQLTPEDRSLNVMPLFHIHGLLAGLLAPLSVGASVAATAGFDAFKFFAQLAETRPTYYTAVPTMHQMLLARASLSERNRRAARAARLRFVRSSSASLPVSVMGRLSDLFDTAVIEAYGMTEATHQMCSNPLPPANAKPCSVGLPTGIDLAILDERHNPLPAGERGEVSIKGTTVINGYENNPEANKASFTDGWFRTGDEGYLDSEGYLFLTGRLKEQINRGGEKISPLEVDEALLSHDSVAEAVTFALPHEKLGEEPAAAVVLADNATLSERDLKNYLATLLAAFKVPRKIVFLETLPKGPTGKLQRIGLAERLGLTPR